jgi:hypothetical protein
MHIEDQLDFFHPPPFPASKHISELHIEIHSFYHDDGWGLHYHWWRGVDDVNDRPVENPKRRFDEYSSKFSLSYETKVYQSSRKKPNSRR